MQIRVANTWKEVWGEDAEVYNPDRWLNPLPESVTDARVPGVYSNLYDTMFHTRRNAY